MSLPASAMARRFASLLRAGRVLVGSFLVLLGAFTPTSGADAGGANDPTADRQQMASLICNFLRNFRWPASKLGPAQAPFVVGVYGTDGISEFLREDVQNRLIQGRSVMVKRLTAKEEIGMCHLIFVGRSERDHLRPVLSAARRDNVLTVGESENFLNAGGIIQFTKAGGQMRYQISLDAARRQGLEPNGFVLRLAVPQSATSVTEDRRVAEWLTF